MSMLAQTVRPVRQNFTTNPIPASGSVRINARGSKDGLITEPGQSTLRAGQLRLQLRFVNGDGVLLRGLAMTCQAPTPAPVIGTVSVTANSTTELTVKPRRAKFGEQVRARAHVSLSSGTPVGAMVFTLGSRSETVPVTTVARAQTTLLADLDAGSRYRLTARFAPTDAGHVRVSSGSACVKVVEDKTNVQVRVAKTRTGRKVKARVVINAVHGEQVSGKVKVLLSNGGKRLSVKTKGVRNEKRKVGLIQLSKPGKYKVRVKYLGDSNFRKSADKTVLRVARR